MENTTARMNYEAFKRHLTDGLCDYLPEPYCRWQPEVNRLPKINGFVEALNLSAPSGTGASPNLYLKGTYEDYKKDGDMEKVLRDTASFFVNSMEMADQIAENFVPKDMEPRIIFTLINRQKNLELLNRVPHRNFLDLSVIYRLLADFSGETVYSAIITDAIAKEMGMTEEQLYQQAVMTTRKEMPPLVDTLDKGFYLITNCTLVMGAVTIFYRDILQELAEKETDDLYIIPSSIHEVFAVPVKAVDGSGLALLIKDINRRFVDDSAVLSDQLYLYDRKERALRFAHSIVN